MGCLAIPLGFLIALFALYFPWVFLGVLIAVTVLLAAAALADSMGR